MQYTEMGGNWNVFSLLILWSIMAIRDLSMFVACKPAIKILDYLFANEICLLRHLLHSNQYFCHIFVLQL